ncbi:ferritin-like domain-containing protein [Aequorivita viscosa]|nr:ferritin-like domain-containing protein [Aequorivita viscosa]
MKNKMNNRDVNPAPNGRRRFLKIGGAAVIGTGLFFMTGCSDDDEILMENTPPDAFDLGGGNLGILNYAYALEQLEAAFYTKVIQGSYYSNAPASEKTLFKDIYNHEVIHRDFFKTAISAAVDQSKVLPELEFDFSAVDFSSRDAVLGLSQVLEDTGVRAYNGAGQLIDATDSAGQTYLLLAGKIVSVEARHASAIRDLINPGSMDFAGDDVLIGLGGTGPAFDKAAAPKTILNEVIATGFLKTAFTAFNLPNF